MTSLAGRPPPYYYHADSKAPPDRRATNSFFNYTTTYSKNRSGRLLLLPISKAFQDSHKIAGITPHGPNQRSCEKCQEEKCFFWSHILIFRPYPGK
jgi:hypothetical protein